MTTMTPEQTNQIETNRRERWPHGVEFLAYVKRVSTRSRRDNAILRRCILDRDVLLPEAYRIVAPWANGSGEWMETMHYDLAGLYATFGEGKPDLVSSMNFGDFCRDNAYRMRLDNDSLHKRFALLISSNRDDLLKHLCEMFFLLGRNHNGLDWFTLFSDMRYWGDNVKKRWSRAFWGRPRLNQSEPDDAAPSEAEPNNE